jgi:gamma-glutamyltranspeptidase/glutathione hydrolase
LDAHSRATGGYLCASDLQDYRAQWVEPIKVSPAKPR